MPDLTENEQDELRSLLEEDVIELPTIVFTVIHIGSREPLRTLPRIYPTWWKGQDWWDSLPVSKRRELAARK